MTTKRNKKQSPKELYETEKRLSEYQGADKVVHSGELYEKLKETAQTTVSIDTGLPSLDRMLDGVQPGELIVVTGLSGQGKTTLLMSITKNLAALKEKCLWFTLEVTPSQFMDKLQMGDGNLPDFFILVC